MFNTSRISPMRWIECQTQSAMVSALPWKRAHQDDPNDTYWIPHNLYVSKACPGLHQKKGHLKVETHM